MIRFIGDIYSFSDLLPQHVNHSDTDDAIKRDSKSRRKRESTELTRASGRRKPLRKKIISNPWRWRLYGWSIILQECRRTRYGYYAAKSKNGREKENPTDLIRPSLSLGGFEDLSLFLAELKQYHDLINASFRGAQSSFSSQKHRSPLLMASR